MLTLTDTNHGLYWTKDAFTLNYSIFSKGQLVGKVTDTLTNRSAKASIFGEKFIFESEGIIKPRIRIINMTAKKVIGHIDFEIIRAKAHITISEERYSWKFNNLLHTKWILTNEQGAPLLSGKRSKEGFFNNHPDVEPILLLCALIIRNRFTKRGY